MHTTDRLCAAGALSLLLGSAPTAHAQSNDLHSEFARLQPGISDTADPDGTKRKNFLKDVIHVGDGYYVKRGPEAFMTVVDELNYATRWPTPFTSRSAGMDCSLGRDFVYSGRLDEDKFRVTYIFKRGPNIAAALTATDTKKQGYKVLFPHYLATHIAGVGDVVSALTVAGSAPKNNAVWKTTWHNVDMFFELYVKTSVRRPFDAEYDFGKLTATMRSVSCTWGDATPASAPRSSPSPASR